MPRPPDRRTTKPSIRTVRPRSVAPPAFALPTTSRTRSGTGPAPTGSADQLRSAPALDAPVWLRPHEPSGRGDTTNNAITGTSSSHPGPTDGAFADRSGSDYLFEYLHHSIVVTANYLDIQTPIVVSSTVGIDHTLKAERKVLALCEALGASRYVNAIGGREMYSAAAFAERHIDLKFIQSRPLTYPQYGHPFVPGLSIVDVLMFNSRDAVRGMLGEYDLV